MTSAPNYGARLKIGMILAAGNSCAEPDAQAVLPAGVSVHVTRLELPGTEPAQLRGMIDDAEKAARLLVAPRVGLIVFHCTAASTIDPDSGSRAARRIEEVTGIPATATSEALVAALNALGANKIVLLSPYDQHVNDAEVAFFKHYGIQVLEEKGFPPPRGERYPYASPQEWRDRALAMRRPDADACFLSCTNIRCISIVDELEQSLGMPVITSNTAMLWHVLRKGGIADAIPGYGRLLHAH
jgi:maleate isomerase